MSEETGRHGAALDRLMASRARLAQLLLPAPPDAAAVAAAAKAGWATPRRWRAQWRLWSRRGPLAPLLGAVGHGVSAWWRRHPWGDTASVVGELAAANVRPLIRRHPLLAIGLGAAAGAALVSARPWRWRALRVQASRGTRQAFGWVLGQLSQPAIQLLITGLLVGGAQRASAPDGVQPGA